MKKIWSALFGNGWVTLFLLILCAALDLIGLTEGHEFGAGIILAIVYMIGFFVYNTTKKEYND